MGARAKTACVRERAEGESSAEARTGMWQERQALSPRCGWAPEAHAKPPSCSVAPLLPGPADALSPGLAALPPPLCCWGGLPHRLHVSRQRGPCGHMAWMYFRKHRPPLPGAPQSSRGEMAAALPRCCLKACESGFETLDSQCQL